MSEKKTITISLENLEAIFEKCAALPPSEKKALMATIKAHDESLVKARAFKLPFLSLYCVETSVKTSLRMPQPTATRVFKAIRTFEDILPYEIRGETDISHLVVVTVSVEAAVSIFDLLLAQKGLKIRFLEFLILTGVAWNGALFEPPSAELIQKELDRTPLGMWGKDSPSIKIIRVQTSIDDELDRHVRFVAESGSLRMVRALDDQNRVVPQTSIESSSYPEGSRPLQNHSGYNKDLERGIPIIPCERRARVVEEHEKESHFLDPERRNPHVRRSRSRSPPLLSLMDPRLAHQRPAKVVLMKNTDVSRDPRLRGGRDHNDIDNNNRIDSGSRRQILDPHVLTSSPTPRKPRLADPRGQATSSPKPRKPLLADPPFPPRFPTNYF